MVVKAGAFLPTCRRKSSRLRKHSVMVSRNLRLNQRAPVLLSQLEAGEQEKRC